MRLTRTLNRLAIYAGLIAAFTGSAAAAPLTAEKLLTLPRLSDPQVSPDSQWIAYVVTQANLDDNNSNSDIYLMRADGTGVRQLSRSPKADNSPRWSPDGKQLAFLSGRGGTTQIWSIDPTGGEAQAITDWSAEVDSFTWQRDGKGFVFSSTVWLDCDDDACNKRRSEAQEKSKKKVRIIDTPLYRHWDSWLGEKQSRLFRFDSSNKKYIALTPRGPSVPPIALGGIRDFDLSPDGKELAFASNFDTDLSRSTNNDIFLTDLQGRPPQRFAGNAPSNDNSPFYSPDGRYIAFRSQQVPGYESDRIRLKIFDRRSRQSWEIGGDAALNNWMEELVWSPDGKRLYFTIEDRGYLSLWRYEVEDKRPVRLTQQQTVSNVQPTADGRSLVYVSQAFDAPQEIFIHDLIKGSRRQLTQQAHNALAGTELGRWQEVSYKGADGHDLHGFLVLPPGFKSGAKYPLVMVVHGGPQGAWINTWHSRWNAQLFAAPGYVAFLPNPRGSVGYGQEFTAQISKDWGGKCYDDLMAGVDHLIKTYNYIDGNRLAAAGGSFGGYMTNWLAGHTNRFKALITHAGVSDLFAKYGTTEEKWFPEWDIGGNPVDNPEAFRKWSPMSYAKNFQTPMLILHGELDFRVGIEQAYIIYTELQRRHIASRMVLFPNEGHWIQKPQHAQIWWQEMHAWLKRFL